MKKTIVFLLLLVFIMSLFACTSSPAKSNSVMFYYIKNDSDFDGSSSIIVPYYPIAGNDNRDYTQLLTMYFNGPANYTCSTPFPSGTTLEDLQISGSKAQLTLSPQFATTSDVNLTIACACITRTVIALTGVNSVQIRVSDAQLFGEDYLTFHLNSFADFDELPMN